LRFEHILRERTTPERTLLDAVAHRRYEGPVTTDRARARACITMEGSGTWLHSNRSSASSAT
jgi:hypothetical protein